MPDKYILNIGSGIWQLPFIEAIKQLGYKLIAVDYNKHAPGFKLADEIINLSAYEPLPIFEELKKNNDAIKKIEAVVTMGSRGCITTASKLANLMGAKTNCLNEELAKVIVDRNQFRKFLNCKNIDSPRHQIYNGKKIEINTPFVVKATVDTSGSQGISLVKDFSELTQAAKRAIKAAPEAEIIVEEFIEGDDYGVFGLFNEGEIKLIQIIKRTVSGFPYFLPLFYSTTPVEFEIENLLKASFIKLVNSFEYKSGPFYVEFKHSNKNKKVYPIECEPTIPAHIDYLVSKSNGINLSELALRSILVQLNENIDKTENYSACKFLYADKPGVLNSVEFPEDSDNGLKVLKKYKVGQKIKNSSAADILAVIYSNSNSIDEVTNSINSYFRKIAVKQDEE